MNESAKTVAFVVTAGVLGVAAFANTLMNQPGNSGTSELVGKPFYEEFTSTEAARSLEVSALDPETGALKRFGVESDGALWRIPTHYDYPAEAAARIAETSSSVMGIEREAIVGMGESEFEKFGVVDPLADNIEDPETAGKRITLKDENGDALVDYIIGKEVEDAVPTQDPTEFNLEQQKKDFYVRRADETQTFRVAMDIDLSTRFSDWIDPDLLRINRPDVTEVSINNYKIEEKGSGPFGMTQLFKVQGDKIRLSRPTPADSWLLDGINDQTEEVETTQVNDLLGALDQMQIVGVRPKFKYNGNQLLTAELKPAEIPEFENDPEKANSAYQRLQEDLMDKGFNFGGSQENLELVSENGELEFGTSKGLRYRLHVGKAVTGDNEAIEIGSAKPESNDEADDTKAEGSDNSNRFLYVRVTFDEKLLGERPAEPKLPEPPAKPEGYVPAAAKESAEGEAKPEAEKEGDAKPDEPTTDDRNPEFIAYDKALAEFETAKSDHEMNLTRFKQDNEAFDKKIEDGEKLVAELNQRFGDWYYVISGSNLNTLQSTRADLVKAVEKEGSDAAPTTTPTVPDISFPDIPDGPTFETSEGESKGEGEMTESAKAVDSEGKAVPETEKAKPEAEGTEPAKEENAVPAESKGADKSSAESSAKSSDPVATDEAAEATKATDKTETEANAETTATETASEKPKVEDPPAAEEKPTTSGAGEGGQE